MTPDDLLKLSPFPAGRMYGVMLGEQLQAVFVIPQSLEGLSPVNRWFLQGAIQRVLSGAVVDIVELESCELSGRLLGRNVSSSPPCNCGALEG